MPKRGFTNFPFRTRYDIVSLDLLNSHFQAGETVRLEVLVERGLLREVHGRLKVLGDGELSKSLSVVAHRVSESARKKIESAGGKIESIGPPPKKRRKPVIRPKVKKPAEEPSTGKDKAEGAGAPAKDVAGEPGKGMEKGAAKAREKGAAKEPAKEMAKGAQEKVKAKGPADAGKPEKAPKKGQKDGQKEGG
jgi:hypothetical protein